MNKRTTTLLAYGVPVLLAAGAFLAFESRSAGGYSEGALVAEQNRYDFGEISMLGGDVAHDFILVNEGPEPVRIQKAYTSCMCTTVVLLDETGKERGAFGMQGHGGSSSPNLAVSPGGRVRARAVFDPAAHGPAGVGLAERSVYLETDSAVVPKVELSFRAVVKR